MIKIEFSKNTHGNPDAMREAVNGLAAQVGLVLARRIRQRVEEKGLLAEPTPAYSDRKSAYDVAPSYPVGAAGKVNSTGAKLFASSEDYHRAANVQPGTYSVSGGMWDGLTMQASSATFARVFFRGRSEGQRAKYKSSKKGGTRATGAKISNALKASSILAQHGIGLLDLTQEEWDDLTRGVEGWVARGIDRALWADVQWPKSIDTSFFAGM